MFHVKYKNKYVQLKNQFGGVNSISIDKNIFYINQEYYIADNVGENTDKLPQLSIFTDAKINLTSGFSPLYTDYHFDFKLFKTNYYDVRKASIYLLTIRRIII
jgi:hypothetical protein